LPQNAPPAWNRKAFEASAPPPGLPQGTASPAPTQCWKADYAATGTATIWTCAYPTSGGAFDAVQRARAEADTVKFQEGNYFVIATWSGSTRADVTSLVRAIQAKLQAPK
jgi:hypothetical protein